MRTKGDRDGLVQMLMNGDSTTGERRAQLTTLELPGLVGETDRIIAGHDALVLQGEDQVKIFASQGHESRPTLTGRLTETLIELLHVLLTEKTIGLLQSLDPPGSQLRRQTSLPSAKSSFTAPARLG